MRIDETERRITEVEGDTDCTFVTCEQVKPKILLEALSYKLYPYIPLLRQVNLGENSLCLLPQKIFNKEFPPSSETPQICPSLCISKCVP